MKSPIPLLCLSISAGVLLSSCEVPGPGGYSGPYYGGGGGGGGGYSRATYSEGYETSRPYGNAYYGGRYNNGGRYVDRDHDRDHDDHRGGWSNNNSNNNNNRHDNDDDRKVKLIRGHEDDKPNRPDNYHTVDWYHDHGYNLHDYAHKDEDGDVHDPRKHKPDGKKKDDDNKKNQQH